MMEFENIVCTMAVILSRFLCVYDFDNFIRREYIVSVALDAGCEKSPPNEMNTYKLALYFQNLITNF